MGKSFNQAKQLFVATSYNSNIDTATTPGTIFAKKSANGEDIILKYINAKGEHVGSGVIPVANIMHVTSKSAEAERKYLKKWTVVFNPAVNSGAPKAGENYILNVSVGSYFDNSDVNNYFKNAGAHAYQGTNASSIYKQLAIGIANNFSKEIDKPLKVFIGSTEIKPGMKESDIKESASAIIIKEAEPYWSRNAFDFNRYDIKIESTDVEAGGGKLPWANITETESTTEYIGNGKVTAELEDMCLSLSSDFQKPVISTPLSPKTMVDPDKEYNYLQIHWCYIGSGMDSQRSEKDIVIVSETASVLNSIIGEINTATGKNYKTIQSVSGLSDDGD